MASTTRTAFPIFLGFGQGFLRNKVQGPGVLATKFVAVNAAVCRRLWGTILLPAIFAQIPERSSVMADIQKVSVALTGEQLASANRDISSRNRAYARHEEHQDRRCPDR
jgi:hypothetical protein